MIQPGACVRVHFVCSMALNTLPLSLTLRLSLLFLGSESKLNVSLLFFCCSFFRTVNTNFVCAKASETIFDHENSCAVKKSWAHCVIEWSFFSFFLSFSVCSSFSLFHCNNNENSFIFIRLFIYLYRWVFLDFSYYIFFLFHCCHMPFGALI